MRIVYLPMSIIAEARDALGVTQSELAKMLGLNQSTVSRFENGQLAIDERTRLAVEAIVARGKSSDRRKVAA
jgi:transcriptional regulator with XRE-family HTH domain